MKKTLFIKNAAILTASSLLLRFVGIFFKVWLAAKIGAEGIGLYQLVFSVYMFSATFATSGISTAVTRLVSEQLALENTAGIKRILKRCCQLSLLIAAISVAALFFGSKFISVKLLHDARAALSIKIFAFSLPFMGFCSCLKGYFIARRRASTSSSSQLLEQAVRIACILLLIGKYSDSKLEHTCAIVLLGDTVAEAVSCLYLYVRYRFDLKRLKPTKVAATPSVGLLLKIAHIALPITSGRYLNSALRTTENILVPVMLSAGGKGISLFGMIKGMALPILFFPSTLLSSLSTLLIPEMSEAAIKGHYGVVQSVVGRIIKITTLVSVIFAGIFLVGGKRLGVLVYGSADVGFLLCALSPIVPFMYLDAICDGILKGLDQQKFTFRVSVCDSALRIVFTLLFLRRFGIYGFIGIMYFSNALTGSLNTGRLLKVSGLKPNLTKQFIMPICLSLTVCLCVSTFVGLLGLSALFSFMLLVLLCVPIYLYLLWVLEIIDCDDISFIKRTK